MAVILGLHLLVVSGFAARERVIQINIEQLLNCRPVTTLSKGNITVWNKGVDHSNGYLTRAAAVHSGDADPHALPDDPLIPATDRHPEIRLHYSNTDEKNNQACLAVDSSAIMIEVPKRKYSEMFLAFTSAYGASDLEVELLYENEREAKSYRLPDWWKDVPEADPDISYLLHNLGKWAKDSKLTEKDHHNINLIRIRTDKGRTLRMITVKNRSKTYLVFWGAAGTI